MSEGELQIFLVIGGLCLAGWVIKKGCDQAARHRAPDARTFVASPGVQNFAFPSGPWRGYYCQYGRQHALCDFSFNFASNTVSGRGVDDVGEYTISGVAGGNRVAFQKKYITGSRAENGFVNHRENLGHTVEYRGEKVGISLAQGIKGHWYVDLAHYNGKGEFHLWPGMPNWHQFQPSAPPRPTIESAPAVQFRVTSDNVCVVCFDRAINVCLQPCGHVAVCSSCADQLRPPTCPICRTHISGVCDSGGNPFAGASAPPRPSGIERDLAIPLATTV